MSFLTTEKIIQDAIRDVLSPMHPSDGERLPIFEFGHETTPTETEMESLISEIASVIKEKSVQKN